MTDATQRRAPETATPRTPRWRLVAFWVLLAVLLFLHFGERPEMLGFLITAFGDVGAEMASHEMHMFAQGVFAWLIVAAVLANLRRATRQVGAAWAYGLGTVLAFTLVVVFADLPPEVVPILIAAIGIAIVAFLAHPSTVRAKFSTVARPSRTLLGLTAIAAVPLFVYAAGQLNTHLGSGPGDEHFTFGHWVIMAVVAVLPVALAVLAGVKVPGWRFPLWAAGLMVAALGVGSLGISAVSQFSTLWALLAIVWGGAFVAAGELEARRTPEPALG